jgi:hypothetical protein
MRIKFRGIGIAIGIFLVLMAGCSAKADSFTFSFEGPISGSGTLITGPWGGCCNLPCPVQLFPCSARIISMTGQVDGQNITGILMLGDTLEGLTPSLQVITHETPIGFATTSAMWGIECIVPGTIGPTYACDPHQLALFGIATYKFVAPTGNYTLNGIYEPIELKVPEPNTLLLLGAGLLCMMGFFKNKLR